MGTLMNSAIDAVISITRLTLQKEKLRLEGEG